jgi:hypothetical protein
MPSDYVDELQAEAQAAMARMREAALAARHMHAKAELLRHMRTTAGKIIGQPRQAAVDLVVREWMKAWGMTGGNLTGCEPEMRAFTAAFCAHADGPSEFSDQTLREATAALERAWEARGTTLADQMAWRSECAHGWWDLVCPTPADVAANQKRQLPRPNKGQVFWEAGCADHCRE